MVKNVQSQVFRLEPLLTRSIYLFIYKQLQDFMHCSLPEPIRKADKRSKEILKGYLWINAHCDYFTVLLDNNRLSVSSKNRVIEHGLQVVIGAGSFVDISFLNSWSLKYIAV